MEPEGSSINQQLGYVKPDQNQVSSAKPRECTVVYLKPTSRSTSRKEGYAYNRALKEPCLEKKYWQRGSWMLKASRVWQTASLCLDAAAAATASTAGGTYWRLARASNSV